MGGFTTSYTWKGFRKSEAKRLIQHDARDVEELWGRKRTHSNKLIRPEWTARNVSLMNDGAGNLVPMTSVEDAYAFLEKRLGELQNTRTLKDGTVVKVAHRKDANALVGFILELDPRFTRDKSIPEDDYDALSDAEYATLPPDIATMSDKEIAETERYLQVMLDEVIERVGVENIVSVGTHWDETHPHVHVLAVPEFEGQVSYTRQFGGNSKAHSRKLYVEAHDRMRTRLQEAGYDATMERLARRPHEPLAEFKARRKRERDVNQKEREMQTLSATLTEREQQVQAARQSIVKEAQQARQRGYEDGRAQGLAEGQQEAEEELSRARRARKQVETERNTAREEGRAQGLAEGRQVVEEQLATLRREWSRLRGLEGDLDDAIRDVKAAAPTPNQMHTTMQETVRADAPDVIYKFLRQRDWRLKEQGKQPGWVGAFERFAVQQLGVNWRETWTAQHQRHGNVIAEANKIRERVKREAEEVVRAAGLDRDDGMEL